jgi:hypothetical protein
MPPLLVMLETSPLATDVKNDSKDKNNEQKKEEPPKVNAVKEEPPIAKDEGKTMEHKKEDKAQAIMGVIAVVDHATVDKVNADIASKKEGKFYSTEATANVKNNSNTQLVIE